jgi:hypothetical protein
VKNGCALVRTG